MKRCINNEDTLFRVSGAGKIKKMKCESEPKNLKEEFGKVYAKALYDVSANKSFNDDGGCYYDMLNTEVINSGDWTSIYQPTKGMKNYEDGIFYYIFKYKEPITLQQFKSFQPIIKKINQIYLQSYNDVLKHTGNKWSLKITTATFKEISQTELQPYLDDKGVIKMSMTIRGYDNWTCADYWDPVRLLFWIKDIPFDEKKYEMDPETLERYAQFRCDAIPVVL